MFDLMSHANRNDGKARMDAFIHALMEELNNDDEPWNKKGRQLARALQENDAEAVWLIPTTRS